MDLTKIPLPTFILERRSLLEMYADFFCHPDLFVKYGFFLLAQQGNAPAFAVLQRSQRPKSE